VRWRLFVFRLARQRRVAFVVVTVVLVAAIATATVLRLTRQEFALTVHVADADYAASMEVDAGCCRVAAASVGSDTPVARFLLKPGDYVLRASPSSRGYFQHWYFVPVPVHVDGDITITVRGNYGAG